MTEETTSRLEKIMKDLGSKEQAEAFSDEHAKEPKAFFEYINEYIAVHQIVVSEMVERSGISKNYVYNILNGVTKNPGRDKIIAVCIASGMKLEEINRGLKISGNNSLYPKNKRDVFIATCVNMGMNNITEINIELMNAGIQLISV